MNKKLDLITNNSKEVFISGSNIGYKGEDGNNVYILEPNDCSRILHLQEAINIIKIHEIKDIFSKIYSVDNIKNGKYFNITLSDSENQTLIKNLDNVISNNSMDISFYDSSIRSIELNSTSKTFDLIKAGSDTYTDSVDLNNLIKFSKIPGVSCLLDINVQYSDLEGKVYNKSTTLTGFKYDGNGKLQGDNIIQDLEGVTLSYIEGTLSVSPNNVNIIEYIINKCTVTYGKL